jgi:sulfatase modifying factor 1
VRRPPINGPSTRVFGKKRQLMHRNKVGATSDCVECLTAAECPTGNCNVTTNRCGAPSPLVRGGTFLRLYDGVTSTLMNWPATVSDFRLDTNEATVGRFRAFVAAYPGSLPSVGAGKNPNNASDFGWDAAWNANMAADRASFMAAVKCDSTFQTWTDAVGGNENRPMNCITWYEAFAFCIWDGGRLPTQAEWDYAALGGTDQRVYPWSLPPTSTFIDSTRASYSDAAPGAVSNCVGDGMPGCALTDLINVGSKPPGNGRWGQADLAGNVSEWVLDWNPLAPPNPCTNCAYLTPGNQREFCGGAFQTIPSNLYQWDCLGATPATRAAAIGARCARSP